MTASFLFSLLRNFSSTPNYGILTFYDEENSFLGRYRDCRVIAYLHDDSWIACKSDDGTCHHQPCSSSSHRYRNIVNYPNTKPARAGFVFGIFMRSAILFLGMFLCLNHLLAASHPKLHQNTFAPPVAKAMGDTLRSG